MFRRIWSLTIKEFIHLRNDWWMPVFMLFGGALELILVGWATSRPIANLPIMLLDHDRSPASRQVIIGLENTGTFAPHEIATDMQIIQDAMERGQIIAAVIIPPGFGQEVANSHGQPTLSVILNGAESTPASAALQAVEGVIAAMNQQIAIERLRIDPQEFAGFEPSMRVWFNESLNDAFYTVPAELGMMLEFTVLLFAALAFSRERELGTLEQLLVMPFSSLEIIIGKSIPVILLGLFDFVLMIGLASFFFNLPMRGSPALLLFVAICYLFVELGKGLVISVIAKTQHQAFLLVMMIGMMDFMFTGYAAPVESMPQIVQNVSMLIPARHWLDILRGIMLKGSGLDVLLPQILMMLGLGVVINIFTLRYVRKALN